MARNPKIVIRKSEKIRFFKNRKNRGKRVSHVTKLIRIIYFMILSNFTKFRALSINLTQVMVK